MGCERISDEGLQADKMDALYGEADAEVRARLSAHLAECTACREELAALARVRKDLQSWRLPRWAPLAPRRGVFLPRWLAAAAALLLGVGLGLTASGYLSLRRTVAEQAVRAQALEAQQRRTAQALQEALARGGIPQLGDASLLTRFDARLDEKLRQSEERQARQLEARLSDFSARSDAQRRVDLARVAEGLSYLDGRHGQQLARTNELMSYVLDSSAGKR
jgi:anti-sigma factor RsiW